ncbi:MAG: Gfo/Idh/MocA family oxidoreductase [Deltaproteobacteria bacterium]|nr:Gfo/Idh/MocA family oxidoreductase [Deltaproteobacteria bacterium]
MGTGRWGINVVRSFARLDTVDLTVVIDPDPAALRRARAAAPGVHSASKADDLRRRVDMVSVCTPSADHPDHALALLGQGLHVLVEKPLAMTPPRAEELVREAALRGVTLMVGHQLLFHPAFRRLEELVAEGAIGRVVSLRAERSGLADMEREPDVLWCYGPHDVAMILSLAGAAPLTVTAAGIPRRDGAGFETAAVNLTFASGLDAEIRLSMVHSGRVRRLTVLGERGSALFDDGMRGGRLTLLGKPVAVGPGEALALECAHFVECATRNVEPRTGGAHALLVTRVLSAAVSSARLGGETAVADARGEYVIAG